MIINGNKRNERDFYPTPPAFCMAAVRLLGLWDHSERPHRILDAGAGTGNWGHAVRSVCPDARLVGVDLPEVQRVSIYDEWHADGFEIWSRSYNGPLFDMVIGNPPYKNDTPEKWLFTIWKRLLKPGGRVFWLLRLNWYSSQRRYKRLFSAGYQPAHVFQSCRRLSFTDDGRSDDTDYAMYLWVKPRYMGEIRPAYAMLGMFDYQEMLSEQLPLFEVTA